MAAPTELLDPPSVMSYSGLVDASTAKGQVDEAADWNGAIAAMLAVPRRAAAAASNAPAVPTSLRHLRQITHRRGAYRQAR